MKKKEDKLIEIAKGKPRKEEEKFFLGFSERQLTAVLLIILAATFLVQGTIRYLEAVGKIEILSKWITIILSAIILLTLSIVSITLSGVLAPLRTKRILNILSFITFILGFIIFLAALVYLLVIIQ